MDLSYYRNEYLRDGLSRENLNPNPVEQFSIWFDQACNASLIEPNALVLSTVDSEGMPSSRTVLLKAFDEAGFVFYTNYESKKARDMAVNEHVVALFPWLGLERQVIIRGVVSRISHAESLKYFMTRPEGSQIGAWCSPQSQVISTRSLLEKKWDEMKRKFSEGKIPLPSFWGGYRIEPRQIEFWQGRKNRLHDRFLFSRDDEHGWSFERLAP